MLKELFFLSPREKWQITTNKQTSFPSATTLKTLLTTYIIYLTEQDFFRLPSTYRVLAQISPMIVFFHSKRQKEWKFDGREITGRDGKTSAPKSSFCLWKLIFCLTDWTPQLTNKKRSTKYFFRSSAAHKNRVKKERILINVTASIFPECSSSDDKQQRIGNIYHGWGRLEQMPSNKKFFIITSN